MKRIQKGFTLIELMIVVAIIGILAAVAIPAYQDYVIKAKLSKVQSTMGPVKLALAMYYQENGSFPVGVTTTNLLPVDYWTSLGLPGGANMPAEVVGANFIITGAATTVTMQLTLQNIKSGACTTDGEGINGCTLIMTGTPGSTALTWVNTGTAQGNAIAKKYFSMVP